MQSRQIGELQVSVVGLGCNNFGMRLDAAESTAVVEAALDAGVTYFDTAESYGKGVSEEYLGAALGRRRATAVIATKWGHTAGMSADEHGGAPDQIRRRLDASLRRLGTDHVDHYQLHRPDPVTPIEDTLGCLAELRTAGKIREIGCTHFSADQLLGSLDAATTHDLAPFASIQNHYSLLTRSPETDGVLAACDEHGVAFVPYFPLESGLLTGKYRLGQAIPEGTRLAIWGSRADAFIDDDKLETVECLIDWAADRGHQLLDLALSWHTSNPLVASVIAGATSPTQIEANVAAASWPLTEAERAEVHEILEPR